MKSFPDPGSPTNQPTDVVLSCSILHYKWGHLLYQWWNTWPHMDAVFIVSTFVRCSQGPDTYWWGMMNSLFYNVRDSIQNVFYQHNLFMYLVPFISRIIYIEGKCYYQMGPQKFIAPFILTSDKYQKKWLVFVRCEKDSYRFRDCSSSLVMVWVICLVLPSRMLR